jgi:hypothetical protein
MQKKLTSKQLRYKLSAYVHSSSMSQVTHNLGSQNRPSSLTQTNRDLGLHDIEVADDKLAISNAKRFGYPDSEVMQRCHGEMDLVLTGGFPWMRN